MTADDEEATPKRSAGPFFILGRHSWCPHSAEALRPTALPNEPAVERRQRPTPPDYVIAGILLRLPARSVVRLRPACKLFNAVTSDPSFIPSQAARAAPAAVIEVLPHYDTREHASLYFIQLKDDDGVRVSMSPPITLGYPAAECYGFLRLDASCDGMLCLCDVERQKLFVCNPLIRGDWIQLPDYCHRYAVEVCGFYSGEYRLLRKLTGS